MAAPLVLRIITDVTQTLKATSIASSSFTSTGKAALGMGVDIERATKTAVINGVKMEDTLTAEAAAYRKLAESATLSAREQAKAAQYAELADAKLARAQGLLVAGTRGTSTAAKTAENDLGKLTRGALAGSGVISSLGRSLAFASGGFIAVAGTATLLHNAITEALTFAATEKQVTAQLKTSGLSFEANKTQIMDNLTALSGLAAFSRGDLLQAFGSIVRVSGDVGQSLKLTAVAADVARGRHIALSSASIALAKALGGSSTALRRLGIIVPKSLTGMAALNYVAAKFAGQAEAGATSADHLTAGLTNAGEVIGTALLPTFNRLVDEFGAYITKLEASGRLQKDANEAVTLFGYAFHTLGAAIKFVDGFTGGFVHTLEILIGLELAAKIYKWGIALRVLAGEWGLVGAAATKAGIAQSAALAESGAAGGGAAAGVEAGVASRGIGGLVAGGLLGQVIGSRARGYFAARAAAGEIGGFGAADAAAGVSATGVGALAVAAVIATGALNDFAKYLNDKAGGGSIGDSIIGAITGTLTGGIVGDRKFGIIPELLNRNSPFRTLISPPPTPPASLVSPSVFGLNRNSLFGPNPITGVFGSAKPMQQYWKAFTKTFKQTMDEAQAALTKGSADDIAAAKQEVARIKKGLDEGIFHGPALLGALAAEASDLQQIWSAEAAAAQKRAAAAAAAKQKIITDIQNAIDPIKLEVALSRAQSLGQTGVPQLKALLAAAYKGLARAIANGNQQLIKQAYDQITSLKASIKSAVTTASAVFAVPAKLALDIARDQALGKGITDDLKEERRALYKWIASHRKNIQGVIDAYNQIAAINSQLSSDISNSYGDYKKASVKALTAGLNLTADARRRLEARLAQRGPGGTVPADGTGAAGYVIDPNTGRPVRRGHHRRHHSVYAGSGGGGGSPSIHADINLRVYIDGKQVEATVTKHQQRRRRHNPTQTRGPNAATSTA